MKEFKNVEALIAKKAIKSLRSYADSKGFDILGGSIASIRREIINQRKVSKETVLFAAHPYEAKQMGVPTGTYYIEGVGYAWPDWLPLDKRQDSYLINVVKQKRE